jgi:hypothetical protein
MRGYPAREDRVMDRRLSPLLLPLLPLLLPLAAPLAGCKALALVLPEPTKTVPAEYPYLAGKKVAIAVRADEETTAVYPHVQWEVADHVRVQLENNIRGITVVETRKVVDFQRSDPNWDRLDPADLGKRFGADRVLELDLTQYTTRQPESEYLYRGEIAAAMRVYNCEYPNSQAAYQSHAETVYPPSGPGQYGTREADIRRATMEAFAEEVAGRFYDRNVKVK